MEGKDRERLATCLQAYSSIGRQEDAENMFQATVVHPFLDKVRLHMEVILYKGMCLY